jgi:hypothetical protein
VEHFCLAPTISPFVPLSTPLKIITMGIVVLLHRDIQSTSTLVTLLPPIAISPNRNYFLSFIFNSKV